MPGDEHEGRLDRIERIHQRAGVRAERADAEPPLRFRDSGDLETVADAIRRSWGQQHQ